MCSPARSPSTRPTAERPRLHRRLRADGLRHRGDHGGARARPARLRVRARVRPADHPEWCARRRLVRRHGAADRRRRSGPRPTPATGRMASINNEVSLDGLAIADAKRPIIEWLEAPAAGEAAVTYKLRDWLFSRQRYWGEPFPIVYDDRRCPSRAARVDAAGRAARHHRLRAAILATIPTTCLPEPPLARAADWMYRRARSRRRDRAAYRRETNTMPQWAGSCWYYLRYLDPTNEDALVDPESSATGWADAVRERWRRPLRRRRRARGAAPALRALLAQGAVRPRARVDARAVPAALQPGHDPRGRVHRRARHRTSRRRRSRSATARSSTTASRSTARSARWARA